ncbi:Coenzyme A biosynthesis bifunctional protein CoaBC [Rubripirellula obstinata]|uniref:Coenzyme A biosynthesis bifunctional protein CoaBC n=1 Tax=Rubripirellula obstinata TaxID=406547 RepID=A0A5B1CPH0_9BACT|nr:phosphopantothenoylcysteine decarboxylase [Rubripirellula obstinata]KAA1261845.1 Coenzyme A biosynthesis bifunctional protein CoaBC [Rubripirellula obstinata]
MSRILITSGPTRQYLDPVRYLTNASSGRMGAALAEAAIDLGHEVVIISGPVAIDYPSAAQVIPILTTDEMLDAATATFADCEGAIGAAAPCDYMPKRVATEKISKTGDPISIELIETPDVVAMLGQIKKPGQWVVGFALETEDQRFRATVKLQKKHCDLIVSNGPTAIDSDDNSVELLGPGGRVIESISGNKSHVANRLLSQFDALLIRKT